MDRRGRIDWRYTAARRRDFLRVLAETYDVDAALAAGRLTWSDVCELRARHPDFTVRFEEVIAAGYDRLEAMLIRQGMGEDKANLALAQALLKQRRSMKAEGPALAGAKGAAARGRRSEAITAIMSEFQMLRAGQARGRVVNGKGSCGGGHAGPPGGAG